MKKCPNCRREIDDNSSFCEYCGYQIKRSKKFILWIVLGAVTVLLGIGVALFFVVRGVVAQMDQDEYYVETPVAPVTQQTENTTYNSGNSFEETSSYESGGNSNDSWGRDTWDSDRDFGSGSSQTAKSQYEQLLDTDMRYTELSKSDLYGLTPRQLTYLRNSIYARHGYVFNSDELNKYFNQFSWYYPDSSVSGSVLNKTEQANVEMIKEYQKDYGKEYKPM